MTTTDPTTLVEPRPLWKYGRELLPFLLLLVPLVASLFWLLYDREQWSAKSDEALIQEWIDETRNFRKTLPELVKEYVEAETQDFAARELKREEIQVQLETLTEPTRAYLNQLPGFPMIYRLEVVIHKEISQAVGSTQNRLLSGRESFVWVSPLPRPEASNEPRLRRFSYRPYQDDPTLKQIEIICEYQLHALNRLQQRETETNRMRRYFAVVLSLLSPLAIYFVWRFLQRERRQEIENLKRRIETEHRERELLETRLQQQEAERVRVELGRKLLEQQLDAAQLQRRADEAEKTTLEMKSQLFAGIGIMAGSYAHNIKNLLVRPNDLIARCLESESLPTPQTQMLSEVRSTLGTVTERLQQILSTIRRDPNSGQRGLVNLVELIQETERTWAELAAEKWKIKLVLKNELSPANCFIIADQSHLQQAIENLLFNARDAIFEERNARRDAARALHQATQEERKRALIEAASWRGEVCFHLYETSKAVCLDISDQGIGMTDEVRRNCLQTHFSTKRDNALYEGNAAGMGLGLSFVSVVLEHHKAELMIESAPRRGTIFRMKFPRPETQSESNTQPSSA